MSADLIAAAVLIAPAAIAGPVCVAGHRRARRRDEAEAAACAAFQPVPEAPEPPPAGRVKAPRQPAPKPLATVLDFPTHRRNAA
ncbi:hypothetical protein [Streptomyces lycii]|uniref:Uncharacterized protein n=1 Tax=Streptomyces lycii TaxID=2654337 RepID=A0ABQ7FL99_9ACTN|nr:hypothetical protein [Streptomyces lycii]KAF4408748.1 hypothetical protein GCU69_12560 [Streptomyces lycii]